MRHSMQSAVKAGVLVLAAAGLVACGNISRHIARDGSGAEQLVWPSPDDTIAIHDGGTSPALASLRQIHAGMTKRQIASLVGYPHFNEGAWGVREWDYLFHLQGTEGGVQCQYKILFDKDELARSFYWKPASCADLLGEPKPATEPAMFTYYADAMFAFDSATLSAKGKASLDALARKIGERKEDIHSIRITGYTDALGSKMYNGLLSRQRAHAVLRYLATRGVPESVMTATGLGEADPVRTDCANDQAHAVLVACLAPNRRVEVQVFGK